MDSFKVYDQDLVDVFDEEQLILSTTGVGLRKMAPKWTGIFGTGDIVHINDEKRRILRMVVSFPNPGEIITKYKVYVGTEYL